MKAKASLFIKKKYRAQGNRLYHQTSMSLPSGDKLVKLKVPCCFVKADFIIYLRTPVCYQRVMIFNDSGIYVLFIFYSTILTDSIENYRCPSIQIDASIQTLPHNSTFILTAKNMGEVWEMLFKEMGRLKMDFSIVSCKGPVTAMLQKETKSGGTTHTGPWGGGSRQFHKSRQRTAVAEYSSGHRTGGNIGAKATQELETGDQLPTVQPRQGQLPGPQLKWSSWVISREGLGRGPRSGQSGQLNPLGTLEP